jgi:hypothetical protein
MIPSRPERGHGQGAQAVTEGQSLSSGVQDHASDQTIAQSPGQVLDAAEVLASHGLARLHLDGHELARGVLQDGIHLVAVAVAVVVADVGVEGLRCGSAEAADDLEDVRPGQQVSREPPRRR